jgi:predicted metal-dependent phosphoesterase TrpH
MRGIDLHSHSHFSDGTLSPTALLQHAKAQDVSMLALTDHDTLDGLPEAQRAADQLDITLIQGVEISSQWHKPHKKNPFGVHILALAPKEMQPLHDLLAAQQQIRAIRAVEICQKLQQILKIDP